MSLDPAESCGCPPTAAEIASAVVRSGRKKRRRVRRRKARRRDVDCCPPRDDAGYAKWLLRQRELKLIRDRFYPNYLADWSGEPQLSPGELWGLGSAGSPGPGEPITVGAGLVMSGTTLLATGSIGSTFFAFNFVAATSNPWVNVFGPYSLQGLGAIGIKNTDFFNSLDWRLTATDHWGNIAVETGSVLPGVIFSFWDTSAVWAAIGRPIRFLQLEIQSSIAGFDAAYDVWASMAPF